MFNDTLKIAVKEAAKIMSKGEDFVYNNFNIVNRFKILTQNVELLVISKGETGHSIMLINTEPYTSWENTPALFIPDSLKAANKYDPDEKVLLVANGVTIAQIDDFLKNNKCTYIGTTYKGKHESSEHYGMAPLREVSFSFSVTPGIYK